MSQPTGRVRDAERTREAILDAAERRFAQNGYRGTSLEEVGREAGVSRGTPSYFFGSKDGLYRAVLERCYAEVAAMIQRARERLAEEGEGPEAVIVREIEGFVDFLTARPTFVRLVMWENLNGGEMLRGFAPHVAVVQDSLAIVRDEIEGGRLRSVDPMHLLLSVLGMCWFPLSEKDTMMRALGWDPYDPDFVAARKRHMVELVLRGVCLENAQ